MIAIPTYVEGTKEELLRYYPTFYRNVLEFVAVQEAAVMMLERLFAVFQKCADDSNIITASEQIIAYYEKIIGIKYSGLRTLEERRRLVLVYYNMFGKVSATKIKNAISYYTGTIVDVSFTTKDERGNYILEISCARGDMNSLFLEDIKLLCEKIIPAHLLYRVAMLYKFSVAIAAKRISHNKYYYDLCGTKPDISMLGNINKNSTEVCSINKNYNIDYLPCGTVNTGMF
ncbi:MAG: DUF2313 domain-containing protein [Clostridia bacterium]|nr:DUF2313 domain-containing protein [Clostridia bacterium]